MVSADSKWWLQRISCIAQSESSVSLRPCRRGKCAVFANGLPQRLSSELQHRRCRERSLTTATEALPGWSVLQSLSQWRAYSTAESVNIENSISNRQFRCTNPILQTLHTIEAGRRTSPARRRRRNGRRHMSYAINQRQ